VRNKTRLKNQRRNGPQRGQATERKEKKSRRELYGHLRMIDHAYLANVSGATATYLIHKIHGAM